MRSVLVDTTVWVAHFRKGNPSLIELLEHDMVMIHPLIVGELTCGTPPDRAATLANLARLRTTQQASQREVTAFIEREKLFGLGCGLIDLTLLASTLLMPGVDLWTLDKRLEMLAERFQVRHLPALH